MKKKYKFLMSTLLTLGILSIGKTNIVAATNNIEVYAKEEAFYANFDNISNASSYKAYYKYGNTSYVEVDDELINSSSSSTRVDCVGLKAGSYSFKVVPVINNIEDTSKQIEIENINIEKVDRSGYAHFNYSDGVGAYTDDGVLKDDAVVVYVTDENKNNVEAEIGGKKYTGLANILSNASASEPLDIRIIGSVKTTQWNSITYTSTKKTKTLINEQANSIGGGFTDGIEKTYTASQILKGGWNSYSDDLDAGITTLEGLTSKVKYSTSGAHCATSDTTSNEYYTCAFDSYWNMMDIDTKSNITIEGVGDNAELFQWGLMFKRCNSIEVKNLTFKNYTEDACSFEGNSSSTCSSYGNYWVHDCTFNKGVNNWDFSDEKDKDDGDGATDFRFCHNVTLSYSRYNNTHKTGLIGSSSSNYQYNFTLHHNYYNNCEARLPYARQANIHMYNNYYYTNDSTLYTKNIFQIYDNAYALLENCFIDGYTKPLKESSNGKMKAVNNSFNGSTNITEVSRTTTDVSSNCKPDNNITDYSNFDTDSELFYYDSENHRSNVERLHNATAVPEYVSLHAGTGNYTSTTFDEVVNEVIDDTINYNNISFGTKLDDFSDTSRTITTISDTNEIGNSGIYQRVNSTSYSSTDINTSINSTGLYLHDEDVNNTLYSYYVFEDNYNNGVVKYTVEVTLPNNGSWSFLTFNGKDNNDLTIRTSSSCKIGYRLSSSGDPIEISSNAIVSGQKYKIELIMDFNNNSGVIYVDDDDYKPVSYCEEIKYLTFMTATKTRSFTVNSVSISKDVNVNIGRQNGQYTKNNIQYKAVRFIGKYIYDGVLFDSLSDIEDITINIKVYNANNTLTKDVDVTIDNVYPKLIDSNNSIVVDEEDNVRYYFVIVNGITNDEIGYTIVANSIITLKNGYIIESDISATI